MINDHHQLRNVTIVDGGKTFIMNGSFTFFYSFGFILDTLHKTILQQEDSSLEKFNGIFIFPFFCQPKK